MNTYLNYIVEANLALLLFLGIYKLLLKRETNFSVMRIALLIGIFASLLFPLIHIQNNNPVTPLSLSQLMPTYWLPEVVIGGEVTKQINPTAFHFWKYTTAIYTTGLGIGLLIVILQLSQLFRIISRSKTYHLKRLRIAESSENKPTFSFFHFIFIGQANKLSSTEKQQIIQHESVHVRQWHSFDIVLLNILTILFWFNPSIITYKKIFIQLHEFEADARAVENSDMDKYCSLLARVALQSANFSFANYFNNSLTVKRIEMMRTIKKKIKPWKMVAIASIIPISFFIIACHDQVLNEISDSTVSQTLEYPPAVKADMDAYQKKHPEAKLTYVEGQAADVEKIIGSQEASKMIVKSYDLSTASADKKGILFSDLSNHAEALQNEGKIFTVVEEVASFEGGMAKLLEHLQNTIRYPENARKAGIKGTVYIGFVVNENGLLTDFNIIKGVDPDIDAEALRAAQTLPAWNPGKQNGIAVKQRYVLPISFNSDFPHQVEAMTESLYLMDVKYIKSTTSKGTTVVAGTVISEETHKPLAGINILIAETTSGTITDTNGNFKIEIPKEKSQLVFSFVGYNSKRIEF